jgi:hypothetical protein
MIRGEVKWKKWNCNAACSLNCRASQASPNPAPAAIGWTDRFCQAVLFATNPVLQTLTAELRDAMSMNFSSLQGGLQKLTIARHERYSCCW